jgi:hypothetical protein
LVIYQQDARGKIRWQQFEGAGLLRTTIRDVNGDGKQELIIPSPIDPMIESYGPVREIIWPHVYRLENGKYVETSSEFASYYDAEVLPPIEHAISWSRLRIANGPIGAKADPRWLRYMHHEVAGLTMERDKILRVIGRDPDAGFEQTREWMSSPDPVLVQDALTVLTDIGGHEADLSAAKAALKAARDPRQDSSH